MLLSTLMYQRGVNKVNSYKNFNKLFKSGHNLKLRLHTSCNVLKRELLNNTGSSQDVSVEPFDNQVERRRLQAQRSVVVQVHSEQSSGQLHEYCSQFGQVETMHHYTVSKSAMHFILVEFENSKVVSDVMNACGHSDRGNIIPTHSHMLWFRANQKKKTDAKSPSQAFPMAFSAPPLQRTQLLEWLALSESISDQITLLYQATRLDDLGTRLRYITAQQLEATVSGLFPRARAMPFGSSVNGFGKQGCDLDLVLNLDDRLPEHLSNRCQEDAKCRLMFHAKPSVSGRPQTQRHIDGLADLVQWFLPGCSDVKRILLARVPIVKYRQELTDLECDLSLTNMTAVYMSELLYTFGALDSRLRPLVFCIKRWAAEVGLTNPSPGRWLTNFSLTLLVIFYMQRRKILPTLDDLRQKAGKSDRRMSEDGVNCTFLREASKFPPSQNTDNLETLLIEFFEYYASFDFSTQGIALGTGAPVKKRDHSPLHITNPLEPTLNVSQNISLEETERFKIEARNAAWELEAEEAEDGSSVWGLLKLYKDNKMKDKARRLEQIYLDGRKKTNRLMPVSKLFEDDLEENNNKSKSKLENTVVR